MAKDDDRLAALEAKVEALVKANADLATANEELSDRLLAAEEAKAKPAAPPSGEVNAKGLWRWVRADPADIAADVFAGKVDDHLAELHAMARRHNPPVASVFAERLRRLGKAPNDSGDYDMPKPVRTPWVAHLGQTA